MMEEEAKLLGPEQATEYRGLAARMNYLAMDRADIQFATKEICREMSAPTVGGRRRLKRSARYLKGRPRVINKYEWQEETQHFDAYSDSTWAGCSRTARSTS